MYRKLLSYKQIKEISGMDVILSQWEGCVGQGLSMTWCNKPCINTNDLRTNFF